MAELLSFPNAKPTRFVSEPSETDPPKHQELLRTIIELEHEIADQADTISAQAVQLHKRRAFEPQATSISSPAFIVAVLLAFLLGLSIDPPFPEYEDGVQAVTTLGRPI